MKLFDDFEAVRFSEENLLFVTRRGFIYYIYDLEYKHWRKYRNAGNDHITVSNYQEVSQEEIMEALGGILPEKETDFMRCCVPWQLSVYNMLALLKEDYSNYMSESVIYDSVDRFLFKSNIYHKSYLKLKKLFDNALLHRQNNEQVLVLIKELCYSVIGRDIYKPEIGIIDGHDCSSYFWIMPVRIVDYTDTNDSDNVARMESIEISIEEDDIAQYLTPFLYKYFDDELEANKKRKSGSWTDDNENQQPFSYLSDFEWYLTHNFYTYHSMESILKDINDTIKALSSGKENEFTLKIREKRGTAACKLIYAKDFSDKEIEKQNANKRKEDDTEIELIIDFYRRFIYRMEYMLRIGKENGYNLISFMGP